LTYLEEIEPKDQPGTSNWWLGAKDEQSEGDWRWMRTNEPLTFSNWSSGEPNNADPGEDCLSLYRISSRVNGAWNDYFCDGKPRHKEGTGNFTVISQLYNATQRDFTFRFDMKPLCQKNYDFFSYIRELS